jgi:hypothetical protein
MRCKRRPSQLTLPHLSEGGSEPAHLEQADHLTLADDFCQPM